MRDNRVVVAYDVYLEAQSQKQIDRLPKPILETFFVLVKDLETKGPVQADWPNYSKLGPNKYHCPLARKWVAVWTHEKDTTTIEVTYGMEAEAHNGWTLRVRRQNAGMTQAQLAALTGLKVSNISAMESGKRGIGLDVAKKLAKALKCPPADLLRHKDVEPAPKPEPIRKAKKVAKTRKRALAPA